MKELVKHYWRTRSKQITRSSYLNCHVKGLHSIMLIDSPEQKVRVYIADQDHELFHNSDGEARSLAFHPHHCALTLHVIHGELVNWTKKLVNEVDGLDSKPYGRWLYSSKIKDGEMGFELVGEEILKTGFKNVLYPGSSIYLPAWVIHTVSVPKGQLTAWIVYEGAENIGYQPVAWSNQDLSKLQVEGLYIRPIEEEVYTLLTRVGLL